MVCDKFEVGFKILKDVPTLWSNNSTFKMEFNNQDYGLNLEYFLALEGREEMKGIILIVDILIVIVNIRIF